MFKNILLPIDQSREALETANKAIQLAKSHKSKIIMLCVVQAERTEMNTAEVMASLLNRVQVQIEQEGINCEVLEKEGKPAFVICDVADELNVDLIVMGTRGLNLEDAQGSTAARVIQLAPCPVLVVP